MRRGSGPEVAMLGWGWEVITGIVVGGRARGCSATAPRWRWVCPRLKVNFPLGLGLPGNSLGTNAAFREF